MSRNPWVDPRVRDLRVASVKSYMLRNGWTIKPYPRSEVIWFVRPENGQPSAGFMFGASESLADFAVVAEDLLSFLSRYENRPPADVLNDLLTEPPVSTSGTGSVNGHAARDPATKAGN